MCGVSWEMQHSPWYESSVPSTGKRLFKIGTEHQLSPGHIDTRADNCAFWTRFHKHKHSTHVALLIYICAFSVTVTFLPSPALQSEAFFLCFHRFKMWLIQHKQPTEKGQATYLGTCPSKTYVLLSQSSGSGEKTFPSTVVGIRPNDKKHISWLAYWFNSMCDAEFMCLPMHRAS